MVFAYALNEINEKWVMKIETNKLMSIRKNVEYFENDVSTKFFQIHTVTGCDTTFLHCDGKKYLKKFLKSVSLEKKSSNPKHNWCFMQSFRHGS